MVASADMNCHSCAVLLPSTPVDSGSLGSSGSGGTGSGDDGTEMSSLLSNGEYTAERGGLFKITDGSSVTFTRLLFHNGSATYNGESSNIATQKQGSILPPVIRAEPSSGRSPANPTLLAALLTSKPSPTIQYPDFGVDIAEIRNLRLQCTRLHGV